MHDNPAHRDKVDGVGSNDRDKPDRPDYEESERDAWRDNLQKIPVQLANKDPNIVKKIRTFIGRFGFDENQVCEKIKCDELFRAHFVTDPRKQNIYEKIAAEWISNNREVFDFEHLPTGDPSAVYLGSNGEFVKGQETKGTDKKSKPKSLDFKWRVGNWTVYASHKYTKQSGGSQDSQFNDIRDLISRFASSTAERVALIVIVDGNYYSEKKMQELRHHMRHTLPLSFAIHIEELPAVLDRILEAQGINRRDSSVQDGLSEGLAPDSVKPNGITTRR